MKACPECNEKLKISANKCKCGWNEISAQPIKKNYCCEFLIFTKPCGSKDGVTNINFGTDKPPQYLCYQHFSDRKYKPTHEIELERGVQTLRDAAKKCGMTNREFYADSLDKLPDGALKEQAKKILARNNHQTN